MNHGHKSLKFTEQFFHIPSQHGSCKGIFSYMHLSVCTFCAFQFTWSKTVVSFGPHTCWRYWIHGHVLVLEHGGLSLVLAENVDCPTFCRVLMPQVKWISLSKIIVVQERETRIHLPLHLNVFNRMMFNFTLPVFQIYLLFCYWFFGLIKKDTYYHILYLLYFNILKTVFEHNWFPLLYSL